MPDRTAGHENHTTWSDLHTCPTAWPLAKTVPRTVFSRSALLEKLIGRLVSRPHVVYRYEAVRIVVYRLDDVAFGCLYTEIIKERLRLHPLGTVVGQVNIKITRFARYYFLIKPLVRSVGPIFPRSFAHLDEAAILEKQPLQRLEDTEKLTDSTFFTHSTT
jgi:hypothetical protein